MAWRIGRRVKTHVVRRHVEGEMMLVRLSDMRLILLVRVYGEVENGRIISLPPPTFLYHCQGLPDSSNSLIIPVKKLSRQNFLLVKRFDLGLPPHVTTTKPI